MKRVSLSALQALERTVRHGSQKAAAEALGVTPTAVSHAIRALEARFGVTLLKPDGRGIRPTEAGAQLSARLRFAFDEIDAALQEISDREAVPTVSVTPAFAALWLAPRLARSAALGSPVPMRIDASTDCTDLDGRGTPDIAVRYAGKADGEKLVTEMFKAYESPALKAEGREVSATFIETVWRKDAQFAPRWRDWFTAAGQALPAGVRIVTFDDEHHAVQCAVAGEGRVLASSVLVSNLEEAGLLSVWRPEVTIPGLSYWLITPKTNGLSRSAARASAALRDWMAYPSDSATAAA